MPLLLAPSALPRGLRVVLFAEKQCSRTIACTHTQGASFFQLLLLLQASGRQTSSCGATDDDRTGRKASKQAPPHSTLLLSRKIYSTEESSTEANFSSWYADFARNAILRADTDGRLAAQHGTRHTAGYYSPEPNPSPDAHRPNLGDEI